jgi:hypothetical protein
VAVVPTGGDFAGKAELSRFGQRPIRGRRLRLVVEATRTTAFTKPPGSTRSGSQPYRQIRSAGLVVDQLLERGFLADRIEVGVGLGVSAELL